MDYFTAMSEGFQSELKKIATDKRATAVTGAVRLASNPKVLKTLAIPVGAIASWEVLKRTNKDRKIGRQMRRQAAGRY